MPDLDEWHSGQSCGSAGGACSPGKQGLLEFVDSVSITKTATCRRSVNDLKGREAGHRRCPVRFELRDRAETDAYSQGPWHFLNFLPDPHGQMSFRPGRSTAIASSAFFSCVARADASSVTENRPGVITSIDRTS